MVMQDKTRHDMKMMRQANDKTRQNRLDKIWKDKTRQRRQENRQSERVQCKT
jgi:hypothetical protein